MRLINNSNKYSKIFLLVFTIVTSSSQAKPPSLGELNSEKYDSLATQFTEHLSNHQLDQADKLVSLAKYSDRVAKQVFDSPTKQKNFARGFITGLEKESFIKQIFAVILTEPSTFKHLGVNQEGLPVIRVTYESGGYEYIKLLIDRDKENQLRISDLMFASTGDFSSTAVANSVKYLIKPSDSILKKLLGGIEPNEELLRDFKKLAELRNKGQNKQAYDLLQKLPAKIRYQKEILTISIGLTSTFDDNLYRKELSNLERYHGDDPKLSFMLIDHYFYQEDWAKATHSIKAAIREWADDAALNTLLAEFLYQGGKIEDAISASEYAISLEPEIELAYWSAADLYNKSRRFDDLVNILIVLQEKFSYVFTTENFHEDDEYLDFVSSQAFKEWQK